MEVIIVQNSKMSMLENYPDILIFDELVEILGIGENSAYKLLKDKQIYSKKIGREYKIPKLCVIDFIYKEKISNKNDILKDYGDILDFKEVRKILRNPSRNTLYKLLKNQEIYSNYIANEYKIPKLDLINFIFNEYH